MKTQNEELQNEELQNELDMLQELWTSETSEITADDEGAFETFAEDYLGLTYDLKILLISAPCRDCEPLKNIA